MIVAAEYSSSVLGLLLANSNEKFRIVAVQSPGTTSAERGAALLAAREGGGLAPCQALDAHPRDRLGDKGMPHHGSPDKVPAVRLATLAEAGRQSVPFTSGMMIS